MTDVEERLAQIRALHVETQVGYGPYDSLCEVCREAGGPWPCATAAVLDAAPVAATPPQGIDRDAVIADAMRMLYEHSPHPDRRHDREEAEELVDRMLLHGSYLTAAPDRDIIAAAIQTDFDVRSSAALRVADRILALVNRGARGSRPVEGVVLTPQEAALCVGGLRLIERQGALPQTRDAARTLAARLEADPGRELGGRSSA